MIITCPSCNRKYYVDHLKVKEGKKVRCMVCQTTWFFKPEEDILPLTDHVQDKSRNGFADFNEDLQSTKSSSVFGLMIVFLLILFCGGLFFFRDYIATNLKFSREIYEMLSIDYGLTKNQLFIENTSYINNNGIFRLTGEVQNLSQRQTNIGPLFITVVPDDKSQKPLTFSYKLPQADIQAKGTVKFISNPYQVPYKSFTVNVGFERN